MHITSLDRTFALFFMILGIAMLVIALRNVIALGLLPTSACLLGSLVTIGIGFFLFSTH